LQQKSRIEESVMRLSAFAVVAGCLLLPFPGLAAKRSPASDWSLPAAGSCESAGGGVRAGGDESTRFAHRTGDAVAFGQLPSLQRVLPPPVWDRRDEFFFEGMRLEIGPCFADYAPPASFGNAAAAPARLTADGGLEGYPEGLPFPPASFGRSDPDAGRKWAWNEAFRYQGAGFRGKFRVVDLGTQKEKQQYTGELFKIAPPNGAGAATVADRDTLWFAGGEFTSPFDARNFAWRQYRRVASLRDPNDTDEVQAYLPQERRVRRMPAAEVDGLYVPTFAVGAGPKDQLAAPVGGAGVPSAASGGSVSGSGGGVGLAPEVGAASASARTGFEGLALRPNLWDWRFVEVRDVLAPINVAQPMYPAVADRNFGPSGLSLADRWDLRRAIVLEARRKPEAKQSAKPSPRGPRVIWYFDQQTLVPLYSISDDGNGPPYGIAIYASRWSEARPDYPRWPDAPDRAIRALDPVAAVYASPSGRENWRRESWDFVATPPPDKEIEHLRSIASITNGH
jgi:hypothetical protein